MAISSFHVLAITCLSCTLLPLFTQAQLLQGDCSSDPCLNGGTCREIFGRLHICNCPEKYTGDNCDQLLPCFATPCQNGGTCRDVQFGQEYVRVCICPEGTTGVDCETVQCEATDFSCDGRCFPQNVTCDFNQDCSDGMDEEGCNEIQVTAEGTEITSPYFPLPGYPEEFDFTWFLTADPGSLVGLDFEALYLDFEEDFLYIGEGRGDEIDNALYNFTGYYEVLRILPSSDSLWLRLVTNEDKGFSPGFKVRAYSVNASGSVLCDSDEEFDCGDGVCLITYITCDGFPQCPNGADEAECARTNCNNGDFIPPFEICDLRWYCSEGEDEENCVPASLGSTFYIESPNDPLLPGQYFPNSNATWTLTAEDGLAFLVNFVSFSTEPFYDLWFVGKGDDFTEENLVRTLTGSSLPEPFLIDDNQMFVYFYTDDNKNDGYVLMTVEVVDESDLLQCDKGTYVPRSHICDGLWHCQSGIDEADCGPTYFATIVTPGYPLGYENYAQALWTFQTVDDMRLLVEFPVFGTEEDYDVLRIGSGAECKDNHYNELSGNLDSLVVLSEDNTMCLFFQADGSITDRGIYGVIRAVNESGYIICPENGRVVPEENICDFLWQCEMSGEDEKNCPLYADGFFIPFSSPGYPLPLPQNTTWTWSIAVEEDHAVIFSFNDFDLVENEDFLTFGCGQDPTDLSHYIAVLTGSETPPPVIANCSSVWVRLQTGVFDGLVDTRAGFTGQVQVFTGEAPKICDGFRNLPSSEVCNQMVFCADFSDEQDCDALPVGYRTILTSPGYPESNYDNNTLLAWVFEGEPDTKFTVIVNEFDTEIFYDWVYLGYGDDPNNATYLAALTGSIEDLYTTSYETPSNQLWVVFETDYSITRKGFSITITSVPASFTCPENGREVTAENICDFYWNCEETGEDEKDCATFGEGFRLPFTSPEYPSPLPENTTWTWSLPVEEGLSANFSFYEFDLVEGVDFYTIGCGRDPTNEAEAIAVLTGHETPEPVITNCSLVFARLQTGIGEGSAETRNGYTGLIQVTAGEEPDTCDGRVLPPSEVCNQMVYCSDFSDERDCDALPIGFRTTITSPGYPETPYESNTLLAWIFVGEPGTKFVVSVNEFDTEYNFDFVYIGYGGTPNNETGLAALSGSIEDLYTLNVETPANELWIVFESDSSFTDTGFSITVTSVPASVTCPENGKEVTAENICDFYWNCEETGEDEKDCAPFGEGFRLPFTSPDYPSPLPENTTWTWSLPVEEGLTANFSFYEFDLVEGVDFYTIGCGRDPTNEAESIAVLTGHETPEPVITNCSLVFARLQTGIGEGSAETRNGYTGLIQVGEEKEPDTCDGILLPPSEVCNQMVYCSDFSDEKDCDALPIGFRTTITSPGYPETPYESNTLLAWIFSGEPGTKFVVSVNEFDTEYNFDFVYIGYGDTPNNETGLAALSGSIEDLYTLSVETPANELWIVFESDSSFTDTGFSITVTSVSASVTCPENGKEVTAENICDFYWNCEETGEDEKDCAPFGEGFRLPFTSPDYPSPLPENTTWTWSLPVEEGLSANFSFYEFDLVEGVDFYTIGCGRDPTNEAEAIAVLTGHETPEPVIANCSLVFARLQTGIGEGSAETRNGYTGLIQVGGKKEEPVCDGRELPESEVCDQLVHCSDFFDERNCDALPVGFTTTLTSPGYPESNYGDNTLLAWLFKGEPNTTFAVTVNDFNTEDFFDYLYIGYGDTPTTETGIIGLSGQKEDLYTTYVESPTNELWIVFESDSGITAEGFSITVNSLSAGCPANHCLFNGVCEGNVNGHHVCVCNEGFTGDHCEIEYVNVTGVCKDILPYTETKNTPLFSLNLPLGRDIISTIILDVLCPADIHEAICRILYPPADDKSFPQGPCLETCEALSECRNMELLVDYNCSAFEEFTELDESYPGFCIKPEIGCPLDSAYCQNGGTCVEDTSGRAKCECPEGYTGQYCDKEFEYITGECAEYLPHNQSALTSLGSLKLPISRTDVSRLILNEACPLADVRRAVCHALFPPADEIEHPQALCFDTCEKFIECTNIDLLMDVDCSAFTEFDDPLVDYPGLCGSDE